MKMQRTPGSRTQEQRKRGKRGKRTQGSRRETGRRNSRYAAWTLALALVTLAACSSDTLGPPLTPPVDWHAFDARPPVDAGPPGPTAKERGASEAYLRALTSDRFAQLAPLLVGGGDSRFLFPGGRDTRGRDAVIHAHDELFGAFDSRTVSASRILRTASAQTVEWTMTCTHARDWMGVPATHRPVVVKGVTLLRTQDDGSIVDIHLYFDVAAVKVQLGAGPKDLAALAPSAPPRSEAPLVVDQSGSSEERENTARARAAIDALESASEAAFLAAVSEDVEVITPERPRPIRGKDELRAFFKAIHKSIAQLDTTIDEALGIGRYVVIEYSISGEQRSPIGWVKPQRDNVVRLHVIDVVEMQGGLMVRITRYANLAELVSSPR